MGLPDREIWKTIGFLFSVRTSKKVKLELPKRPRIVENSSVSGFEDYFWKWIFEELSAFTTLDSHKIPSFGGYPKSNVLSETNFIFTRQECWITVCYPEIPQRKSLHPKSSRADLCSLSSIPFYLLLAFPPPPKECVTRCPRANRKFNTQPPVLLSTA